MSLCSSQQQEDTSLAVLDLVVAHVRSVYTLSRLGAVSRQFRAVCAAHSTYQLQALLLPLLRQAAEVPASPLHKQHMASIRWLCRVSDEEAFAAASAAVLAVPNVPPAAVHMLRLAGVRVSNAAVMAAALKQQPGAEAWVFRRGLSMADLVAQLRSPAGTLQASTAAAALVCGGAVQTPLLELLHQLKGGRRGKYDMPWQLLFMHPSHMPDLLRLAVNQQDAAAATAIAEYLSTGDTEDLQWRAFESLLDAQLLYRLSLQDEQHRIQQHDAATQMRPQLSRDELVLAIRSQQLQQVSPQLLDELLLLAAARQHSSVIQQLLKLPGIQQLQGSTVVALLHHTMCCSSDKLCPDQHYKQLVVLCELQAVADIGPEQVASLLLEAVTRRQPASMHRLLQLPAAAQLSSELVLAVALAAVRSSWSEQLSTVALQDVLQQLTPQHMYELLQQGILVATLAGAGMLHMWCNPHATAPVSYATIPYDDPRVPPAIAVIKLLCMPGAAVQLQQEHVKQLLLAAATLGNAGALVVLYDHLPGVAGVEQRTQLKLLQTALQLRNCSMAKVLVPQVALSDDWDNMLEAVTGLVRTDDRELLHEAVAMWGVAKDARSSCKLLLAALQLRRGSLVAALCREHWHAGDVLPKLTAENMERLVPLARQCSNYSTLEGLLDLEPGVCLLASAWGHADEEGERLQTLQQQRRQQHHHHQQQQQQQQGFAAQQAQLVSQQQGQQGQQAFAGYALHEPMLSGELPSSSAVAMLQQSGAAPRTAEDLTERDWEDVWEVYDLLEAAVEKMPAGQPQQEWVALLAQSEYVSHVDAGVNVDLLLAAVHAACIKSCTDQVCVLCKLCAAWPETVSLSAYQMAAAAVQLGSMPALQLLLPMPAVQALTVDQVASLLRWGIHSTSRGVAEDSMAMALPGCTAAHAEVFAAVCRLPAAQQVAGVQLVGLLLRAMQQGSVEAVQQLCRLAGAQLLDTALVRGCLCFARVLGSRPGRDAVVGALCSLRGAQGLRAADVGELLQLYDGVDALMGWAAAESEEAGVEPAEVRLTQVL